MSCRCAGGFGAATCAPPPPSATPEPPPNPRRRDGPPRRRRLVGVGPSRRRRTKLRSRPRAAAGLTWSGRPPPAPVADVGGQAPEGEVVPAVGTGRRHAAVGLRRRGDARRRRRAAVGGGGRRRRQHCTKVTSSRRSPLAALHAYTRRPGRPARQSSLCKYGLDTVTQGWAARRRRDTRRALTACITAGHACTPLFSRRALRRDSVLNTKNQFGVSY